MDGDAVSGSRLCINNVLVDDLLRLILGRLENRTDRKTFGLVCKRWLPLQSMETKKLSANLGLKRVLGRVAGRFTGVVELELFSILDSDIAVIAPRFPCLRVLNLCYCPGIIDDGMKAIGEGLPLLRILNLSHCEKLTDEGLSAVAKGCHDLRVLDVSYCKNLTDEGLSAVAEGCRELRALDVSYCKLVTDVVLKALSKNCPNLGMLELQYCIRITDDGLISLASGCQRIKLLDISYCFNVSDVGVSSISMSCSSYLKTLKLTDCFNIGDATISTLAKSCGHLEFLIIFGCHYVSAAAIRSLATARGSSLKLLDVSWCPNISDSEVSNILSECRNLEVLSIGGCRQVTDAAFQRISNEEPGLSLKILNVRCCPKITVAGIGIIVRKCTSLDHLDVGSCAQITQGGLDEAGFRFPQRCRINFSSSRSFKRLIHLYNYF
ncbi:F-box/LRR-repeat protein 20 [Spatholobus suberectus]|nr:F-box/LRR-repeat protein 20 [Spatholobus suberectus]